MLTCTVGLNAPTWRISYSVDNDGGLRVAVFFQQHPHRIRGGRCVRGHGGGPPAGPGTRVKTLPRVSRICEILTGLPKRGSSV